MNYIEYGKEHKEVIVLLHGGGLSWWNYEEVAKSLQNDYHIILPILDGHAESDKHFTTIENNASEIMDFIDTNFRGRVLQVLPNLYHGEFSINLGKDYANTIREIIVRQ